MRFIITIATWLFSALVCSGQFVDDFSDGDYINNPTWTPDNTSNWVVIGGQLRSNSETSNTTFHLSTPSTQALTAQWEFYVNLQFNTSSVNFVDVYLTSSNATMTTANGYFVRIGGMPDEISLYKSTGSTNSILINGTDGITNTSNNTLKIKVTRDASNIWKLERDVTGTGNSYLSEITVFDNSFATSSFFGIRITQSTASFFDKHFFDDFYVGPIVLDNIPPLLNALSVVSATELNLVFNENLDAPSAQLAANYSVDNGIGNPASALLHPDQKTVKLSFSKSFANGIQNLLTLSGVKDIAGNAMATNARAFLFFQAVPTKTKDVIITEIFADPNPQIGLPDAEYIEIYNRSKNPIDLSGWKLSDASSTAIFPSQIILPNEYWIVTSSASVSKFRSSGKTIGLANFPTLNNDSDVLTLKTAATIDSVNYTLTWYKDEDKQNGGWSLELIDPENTCGENNNWVVSNDPKGGTPGKQNSVFANKPDLTGPKLLTVIPSETGLVLFFDEKLEKPLGTVSFLVDPSVGVSKYNFNNSFLTEIKVELSQPLVLRQLYSIQVSNLRDCAGNFIQAEFNKLSFALPEVADSLDVVVNEILFNPRPSGVDFLEVFNRSSKFINLKGFSIANYESRMIKNPKTISSNIIVAPNSFIVFTSSPTDLKTQYLQGVEKNFFEFNLPGFNDDEGSVVLVNENGKMVDYFIYSGQFHSPLLKDKEGVSLERISIDQNSNESSNWKSASSTSGFATPGYLNSNSRPETAVDENAIQIEPEVFSPSQPSQDFSKINYRFNQSGFVANVNILDQAGRLIKTIANNETLGFEGFFRWDGDRDDGGKARVGYYIIWVEVFDLSGNVRTFRKRVVVAGGE
ncbi:MAG: lamin tail domain-containing protein [Cyclobacteriaceae bacterium]|nr:lamin tail domain-containing protein [Cyclobacteriaceae bacterium]